MDNRPHYLKSELYELVRQQQELAEFLLDHGQLGMWYRDLDRPQHQWTNPAFWNQVGQLAVGRPHRTSAWLHLVHTDDVAHTVAAIERHLVDFTRPFDEVVRFRHADGSTVRLRSRVRVVRDLWGRPTRLLGLHSAPKVTTRGRVSSPARRSTSSSPSSIPRLVASSWPEEPVVVSAHSRRW